MSKYIAIPPAEQAQLPAISTLDDSTLKEQINKEYQQSGDSLNNFLSHALECGRGLQEAKRRAGHGKWLAWLDQNFEGSADTAERYMQIAARWPQLEEAANSARERNLPSIREALRLLAAPKPPASEPDQPPVKRFLDCPSDVRQRTCREWWDVKASYTLVLDAAGWASEKIAEALGVAVHEVDAILDPRPPRYDFSPVFPDRFMLNYENAVAESIARTLSSCYQGAQYAAQREGFAHVVPSLEALEAKYKRIAARLDGSEFALMQRMEHITITGDHGPLHDTGQRVRRHVWPIAVGCCVTDDMREALGIAPCRFPSDWFPDTFTEWCRTVQKCESEGKSAA